MTQILFSPAFLHIWLSLKSKTHKYSWPNESIGFLSSLRFDDAIPDWPANVRRAARRISGCDRIDKTDGYLRRMREHERKEQKAMMKTKVLVILSLWSTRQILNVSPI